MVGCSTGTAQPRLDGVDMPGEFGKDENVMVPSDGDLTERHVCCLMFLVLTRRIGLGRFVDETKFQVCPLLPCR